MTAEVNVRPARTFMLIVDMQNEFCDPAGGTYLGPEVRPVIAATAEACRKARAAGCQIVWTRSVREPHAAEFEWFGVRPYLLRDSWATDFCEGLVPSAGDTVIEKQSHDCFNHTTLETWLEDHEMIASDTCALICGVSLNTCVNHAVLGCSVRNVRTVVLRDCVAPASGGYVEATLRNYGRAPYSHNVTVAMSGQLNYGMQHEVLAG